VRTRVLLAALALVAGCSLSSVGQKALERRARSIGFHQVVVETQADRLAWWSGGSGSPVLLLHGFGGDGLNTWQAQLASFARHHHVLVPDLLWFGGSRGMGTPGLDAQVDAIRAVLSHEGVGPVDVVGISYGGFVAMKLLDRYPELVGRVVVVDSPGPFFTEADEAAMLARLGAPSAEEIFLPDAPEDVQLLLDLTWHKPLRLPRFLLQDLLVNVFSEHREEQRGLLLDLRAQRGAVALPEAPPEALVVWGRYDEVFPVDSGQRLADALGARFEVIERTAHGPPIERPEAFNRLVLEWLGG